MDYAIVLYFDQATEARLQDWAVQVALIRWEPHAPYQELAVFDLPLDPHAA